MLIKAAEGLPLRRKQQPTWLIAAALALLLCAIAGWHFDVERRETVAAERRDVENLCETLAAHAARSLESASLTLSGLVDRIQATGLTKDLLPSLERYIGSEIGTMPQLGEILVLDANRQILFESQSERLVGDETLDAAFVAHRTGDRAMRLAPPRPTDRRPRVLAVLSRRLDLPDGSFGGIVVETLSPTFFTRFYDRLDLGASSTVTLVSLDGILLLRRPFVDANVGRDLSGTGLMNSVRGRMVATMPIVSALDGVNRLLSYQVLPDYPLIVAASVADRDYRSGWLREVAVEGSILLLILVAIVLLVLRNGRLEIARENSARNYRLLADNGGDMVLLTTRDGTIEYCSPACRKILGYDPDEMLRLRTADIVPPEDLERALALHAGLSPQTPDAVAVLRHIRKDGSIIWVEAVSRLATEGADGGYAVLTVRDVTARILAEKSASAASARALLALEATTDFVVAVDRDWILTYVNGRVREGAHGGEYECGRALWEVAPDFLGTDFERAFRQVMDNRSTLNVTARIAGEIWYEAQAVSSNQADGGIIIFFKDVTAAQKLQAALLAERDAAKAAATAKSEFLANMTHELRTPLNAVIGFAEILEREMLNPSDAPHCRQYAIDIRQSGEHLLGLINEILDYSRAEAGHLPLIQDHFEPRAAVESCVRMVGPRAERTGISLVVHAETAPDLFWADEKRVRQILLNLLSNAVKFTPAGGRINIECTGDNGLTIAVRDTGIGIAPEDMEHVMQAFSQVNNGQNRIQEGTGLGLPLSRRLAEMHGGSLTVRSTLGRGTTMILQLPGTKSPADALPSLAAVAPSSAGPDRASLPVVLFAEDDDTVRANTSEVLRDLGYEVLEAKNGNEAISHLQKNPEIALLITDVIMPPGMDGLALARKARQFRPAIRVILVSGYATHIVAPDADFSEFPVLQKPYSLAKLEDMVSDLVPIQVAGRAAA